MALCKASAMGAPTGTAYVRLPAPHEFTHDFSCFSQKPSWNTAHCPESRWAARRPGGVAQWDWGIAPRHDSGRVGLI
jgi:hypothetical protein